MADEIERDQFSTNVSLRVRSPAYLRHARAIWNLLGVKQVNGYRQALDIGIRAIVERDGSKADQKILKQHLEAMGKS